MEIRANIVRVVHIGKSMELTLVTDDISECMHGLDALKDKLLSVVIKKFTRKRSLNANAYAWVLLSKMAAVLNRDKWDVYIEMLGSYGVFTHMIAKEEAVPKIKKQWREVKELGPIKVNGKSGIQLQCYYGSSTFDTKEMSVFIEGLIVEAKELGIEILPDYEIERMKKEWDQ